MHPEASAAFAVAVHPAVVELNRELSVVGGLAIFGNDDGFAVGPREVLFGAVHRFAARVFQMCHLTLSTSKTKVYLHTGEKPAEAPANMPRAGVEVGEQWLAGFQCYGVAIGSAEYVEYVLGEKVEDLRNDVDKVMDLLEEHHHAAWVLLSTSFSQQLDYLLTLQYPTDMEGPAQCFQIWHFLTD